MFNLAASKAIRPFLSWLVSTLVCDLFELKEFLSRRLKPCFLMKQLNRFTKRTMSSALGYSPPESCSPMIDELALDEEAFSEIGFLSLNLPSSSLDLNRMIACSCSFSLPKSVIIPRVMRFYDSLIAVTLGCQSLVIHLKILLVQSWFETVLPRFCNLFTI